MENRNETVNENVETLVEKNAPVDTMNLLNKFCWPGFIMPHFWGIGNGLTIGFLALFIPVVGLVLSFVFGFCGYQTAYEKGRYDKIQFFDMQVKWRKAAIIYVGFFLVLFLVFGLWNPR